MHILAWLPVHILAWLPELLEYKQNPNLIPSLFGLDENFRLQNRPFKREVKLARAKLYHIPGNIWHLTQRCHNRDFLLKFSKDRKRWVQWLFEAKKRYGLIILNYTITSNHIHLLVYDDGRKYVIPRSILLVASRTAREYNQRKGRRGAFWEDHYHATAIQGEKHLHQCMVYIDLNMVRARVVNHPADWPFTGYNEILSNRKRYRLINKLKLQELLCVESEQKLKENYIKQIEDSLHKGNLARDSCWTESIAIGSKDFVEKIKNELGVKAVHRKIEKTNEIHELREPRKSYTLHFIGKMSSLKAKTIRHLS